MERALRGLNKNRRELARSFQIISLFIVACSYGNEKAEKFLGFLEERGMAIRSYHYLHKATLALKPLVFTEDVHDELPRDVIAGYQKQLYANIKKRASTCTFFNTKYLYFAGLKQMQEAQQISSIALHFYVPLVRVDQGYPNNDVAKKIINREFSLSDLALTLDTYESKKKLLDTCTSILLLIDPQHDLVKQVTQQADRLAHGLEMHEAEALQTFINTATLPPKDKEHIKIEKLLITLLEKEQSGSSEPIAT